MNSIILAALLTLNPGYNNPGVAGEVVAIEAATTNAFLFGDGILVTGAAEGDTIKVLVK